MSTFKYKFNQNTSANNSNSSRPRTVPSISISSSSSFKESLDEESLDTLLLEKDFLKPKSPSIHSTKSFVKESLEIRNEDKNTKKKAQRRRKKKAITAKCSFAFVGMITVFVLAAIVTMFIYQIIEKNVLMKSIF